MKKIILSVLIILFVFSFSVFTQEEEKKKNYDLLFSLSGGNISEKFTLAGDFIYAQKFGNVFFAQISAMANFYEDTQEYGGSIGLGIQPTSSFGLYVFVDSLSSHQKTWTQVRPVLQLRSDSLSLMGFYAYPLSKSTIEINNVEVGAGKYFGGEFNLIPFSWARIYGTWMFVEGDYSKSKIGIEVRVLKQISLFADWNKTSGFYSKWGDYDGFRVGVNVLFGSQQYSFKANNNGRIYITPSYPKLITREKDIKPDDSPKYVAVRVKYQRIYDHVDACPPVNRGIPFAEAGVYVQARGFLGKNPRMEQTGEDLFYAEYSKEKCQVNYPRTTYKAADPYKIFIIDNVWVDPCYCRAHDLWFNGYSVPRSKVHKAGSDEYVLVRFDEYGVPHFE